MIPVDQLLGHCLEHFAYLDRSNAAVHLAPVRYSPITFRLAEHVFDAARWSPTARLSVELAREVMAHAGAYPEDPGRPGPPDEIGDIATPFDRELFGSER